MARTGPFIMPDGRPLGAFLDSDGSRAGADSSTRTRGKKGRKSGSSRQRWEKSFPVTAAAAAAGASEADTWELDAISKVGRERRRRWLNDKILRDMAGALTASEMNGLFQPPPFGGPAARPSALSAVMLPANVPIWDLFRNIDADMQARVLLRWEQHVAQQRGAGDAAPSVSPALRALQAWADTSRKARDALRRASTEVVHALESRIMRLRVATAIPAAAAATIQSAAASPTPAAAVRTDAATGIGSSANGAPDDAASAAAASSGQDAAAEPTVAADSGSGGMTAGGDGDSSKRPVAAVSPEPVQVPSLRLIAPPQPAQQQQQQQQQGPEELRLRLETGFGRLLVHGLAQFHGLASFSRGALDAHDAATTEQLPMEMELLHESPAAEASSPRITVVHRLSQGTTAELTVDDIITVSDILLVMDQQAGSGRSLTASMLDVPGTPASTDYSPPR